MKIVDDYYVYVYIDPRNFEEFYYGKGKGDRKDAHLGDTSDTEKANRIAKIKKAGLQPIIRVIARGLKEDEALLVEKTLLWKLGRLTTNIACSPLSFMQSAVNLQCKNIATPPVLERLLRIPFANGRIFRLFNQNNVMCPG